MALRIKKRYVWQFQECAVSNAGIAISEAVNAAEYGPTRHGWIIQATHVLNSISWIKISHQSVILGDVFMDNFKIIYRILRILEQSLDLDEFNRSLISADTLEISENRWKAIMEMLLDEGYIKGAVVLRSIGGSGIKIGPDISITLKGLEYLNDNSFMKKAANIAKGIKDTIPGL